MVYEKPATRQDVESLIKWLQAKPYDGIYDAGNPRSCLLAQSLKAAFPKARKVLVGLTEATIDDDDFVIPQVVNDIAMNHPRTYGAAMERARLTLPDVIRADLIRESELAMK